MDELMKIGALALLAAALAVLLKREAPASAMLLTLAAAAGILIFAFNVFAQVRQFLDKVSELAQIGSELTAPVIKCACVAAITRFVSSSCRDAGETAMAGAVDLAGALVAVLLTLPLINLVLDLCLRMI